MNMLQVNVDILFIKSINHIYLSYVSIYHMYPSIICIYHSRWYTIHHIYQSYQSIISIHHIHLSYVCINHMYQFIKSINHHIHPLISIISIYYIFPSIHLSTYLLSGNVISSSLDAAYLARHVALKSGLPIKVSAIVFVSPWTLIYKRRCTIINYCAWFE